MQNPGLGPAWTFTDSAVTGGPVGQWVYAVTGLIRDLGGHGLCGTAAALSGLLVIPGLDVWPEQPLGLCGVGATGLGALAHTSEHNLWLCALQEGRRSDKVPALWHLTHLRGRNLKAISAELLLPFKSMSGFCWTAAKMVQLSFCGREQVLS